jgi:hypothetical protein
MITHWSTRRKKLLKVINKLIYTIATFKMIFFSTSTTKIFSIVYIFVLIFGNTINLGSSSFFCLFYCLFVFCVFFVFVFFVFVFILGWMPTISNLLVAMITVYLFISTMVTAAVRFNIRQDVLKHLVLSCRKLLCVFFVFVFFVFVFILGWMPTIFTTFCVFLR